MFVLPDINELKFKVSYKSKGGRNSSIFLKNNEKLLKQINNTSDIIHISQMKSQIKNNLYKENKNKHNKKNSGTSIINISNEKMKKEKEIIPDIIEYNNKSKNKKSILNARSYYSNHTNIFFNKQIDINKFTKEINSLLLQNSKIFENLQNLIKLTITKRKESSWNDNFIHSLKSKDILINKLNYRLIFKYIIKNTFNKSLKKAIINNGLISKKEIKEEYEKQINDIKRYLNLYNKKIKDFARNKNFEPLTIYNYYYPIYKNKISSNENNTKINLERNKRKRIIIQNNSCDNTFFNSSNYNKEFLYSKYHNINMEKKEIDIKDSLQSSKNNTPDKETTDNHIESIMSKRKLYFPIEKRLKDKMEKQDSIFDDPINLKEINKNNENNLIKAKLSLEDNIKKLQSYLAKQIKNVNKCANLINYFNNSDKNFKFSNSLIKEQFNKYFLKENKLKENEFNINCLNNSKKEKLSINSMGLEKKPKNKYFGLKNNITSLKYSFSRKVPFNKNNFIDKNAFHNNNKDNKQLDAALLKENYSHLFNIGINSKNKEKNMKKYKINRKFFLKNNKDLNKTVYKVAINKENYESKIEELNNKIGVKTIFLNFSKG